MLDRLHDRYRRTVRRLRQFERREVRELRRRLEETTILVHVSILLFVPFLVGLLTYLSNQLEQLSFFLFPPLAAGTYALFANPESEYASPVRFVAGLTAGAICAWIAMRVAIWIVYPDLPPATIEVDAPGAAFAVFLTGVVTWALDIEEAAAFSTALLGLLIDPAGQFAFITSVFLGSSIVALVFTVWRDLFYEQRAYYLYESTKGDDHVLIPMRGDLAEATAMLGGRLAAAHDAGKVVLLDVVEQDRIANTEQVLLQKGPDRLDPEGTTSAEIGLRGSDAGVVTDPDAESASTKIESEITATITELEQLASQIESNLDVPCQVIVAASGSSPAETVREAAIEANCDLIVAPYETEDYELSPFVTRLLKSKMDVLVHRSYDGRTDWRRIMVPVRRASDTAHSMIDFARRLAGPTGRVSVAHCIDSEKRRRAADEMLANLVETSEGNVETRVTRSAIERFLLRVAPATDLIIIGASRDRSVASRLVSPPTFEQIDELDTDVAIVDRR